MKMLSTIKGDRHTSDTETSFYIQVEGFLSLNFLTWVDHTVNKRREIWWGVEIHVILRIKLVMSLKIRCFVDIFEIKLFKSKR